MDSGEYKYLKCDVTGACSGIEYGKQGDKVLFIREDSGLGLVEFSGQRFFVRMDKLSNWLVEKEITEAIRNTIKEKRTTKK